MVDGCIVMLLCPVQEAKGHFISVDILFVAEIFMHLTGQHVCVSVMWAAMQYSSGLCEAHEDSQQYP